MINDAINYPIEGDQTSDILLVGGVLSIISGILAAIFLLLSVFTFGLGFILMPLAFIPSLGIMGYYVRVLESTVDGGSEPPAFDDIAGAFKDGLVATAIGVVYYLIPSVLFLVAALFGGVLGGAAGNNGGGALALLFLIGGGGLATVLTIALTYVYPAALTRYATTDDIAAAFAFSDLIDTIGSIDYLVAWLYGLAILLVGGIVASIVGLIPLLGWLAAPVIQFLAAISAYRAWGLAYNAGTEATSQGDVDTTATV